jgi:L-ribulose-5-phosphate 4-epimerase
MSTYQQIREEAFEANLQLPRLGLVLFTFGNVSVADHSRGVMAIKPSGVPYTELSPDKMVIVDFNNQRVEGHLRASSDTATHALLYQQWPEIGSIVHTHSTYATAWAQANRPIPVYGTTHADHTVFDIPCAPPMEDERIQGDYEKETGWQIIHHFEKLNLDYRTLEMMLVGNHAPFVWGADAKKAVYNAAVLEQLAQMAWLTEQINPQSQRLKESLLRKHYERKHGNDRYYGQEE